MTFDFPINGQESLSGAALLGLHSLLAITFLIQAHIPSHFDADGAQDIVHERMLDIDCPTAGSRRGGNQEALDVAAVTGADGRDDQLVVALAEDQTADDRLAQEADAMGGPTWH
jgi:hypothetical protein